MAQEPELPFTWEGKGAASFISEGGINEIEFQFELSVDEQGMVKGKSTSEDGTSRIKHIFVSEPKQYEVPGFYARKIVIVLMFDEYAGNPMLGVLNGRILMDKFIYGEMSLTRYEADSHTAKTLGIGDPEATLLEGGELPYELKSVLKKCLPIGTVKIRGDYRKEKAAASEITESSGNDTIELFSKPGLRNGHVYLKDSDADPKSVWKVVDGELRCSGNPTGFVRTKQEYGDYKLTFEWRWPEKPGNSGVLLHMSSEDKIWPLCMEAQLMHQRAADIVGMGCSFNENKAPKDGPVSYTPRIDDSNEKNLGEWNKYEIVCKGDTMELTINGRLKNKATGMDVRKGYIGFQSEGVPIIFRNIKLTLLN